MTHDYYLFKAKNYDDKELAQRKREIRDKLKEDKDIKDFYPSKEDLQNLPENSILIKISFTLKKPYTSKDEGEFHIIEEDFLFRWKDRKRIKDEMNGRYRLRLDERDIKIEDNRIEFKNGKIVKDDKFATVFINDKLVDLLIVKKNNVYSSKVFVNPIVRDKFTGRPMVRPSTWKGHLRFATRMVEWNKGNKEKIIRRLFGNESRDDKALKGRLYFFPTFFEDKAEKGVITPLDRKTRTPVKGKAPISIEVMKPDSDGEFYLLYIPYPKGRDFKEEQIKEDLMFLAKSLKLMFYTYGFSAKKTSGFGVVKEKLNEGRILIKSESDGNGLKEEKFSYLGELIQKIETFGW